MDRKEYITKSVELLNDPHSYKKIPKDLTPSVERNTNLLIKQLHDEGHITTKTNKGLTNYTGTTPTYYGLPKIHKEGCPLRPIIACKNAPTQSLAKYLAGIIDTSFSSYNTYKIKDSFEFANKTIEFLLPSGYILASFDVTSLFTNIPLELVVSILTTNYHLIDPNCQFPNYCS
ncbi:uncharacterized protein [Diabrotica undecimpunctata]|uniref:uncharacterized protein n=1 Tax=Diabrotica undecimpunctata TaxID=50387 RepID=UPI003B63F301